MGGNEMGLFSKIKSMFGPDEYAEIPIAEKDGKIYATVSPSVFAFYYPYKKEGCTRLDYYHYEHWGNTSDLTIRLCSDGRAEIMTFWKDTKNRKEYNNPYGRYNQFFNKNGDPNIIKNFLYGVY